eukprot:2243875-Pyramimonas_sp.AAC.1
MAPAAREAREGPAAATPGEPPRKLARQAGAEGLRQRPPLRVRLFAGRRHHGPRLPRGRAPALARRAGQRGGL